MLSITRGVLGGAGLLTLLTRAARATYRTLPGVADQIPWSGLPTSSW